ncbi:MAG: nucleotide sugar dehydrogenase [Patescibacteria group bacterium]|nr:nucleotide sugar dehydrogenase [Patescibacteria group bacterium]
MKNEKKTIAIVGLGYVGLPLALRCVERGYEVFGIDLDKKKNEQIIKGKSPLKEDFIEQRKDLLKKIKVSVSGSPIKRADIAIICVPTPVDETFFPDLTPVKSATGMIIKNHKKGQLVIVESTINPGVCEEVVEPLFAEAGLNHGRDFHLAHCPERIDPGNKKWDVTNIPRVVGSMSSIGLKIAKEFYETIIDGEIKSMKSIREAEAVKVVENSFRDINIAFVNELAQSFDQMDIDVKNVIDGAATKPFAFMPHYPSRGVGGHCIPVDPYYLIERAKKAGFDHRFLRSAREVNNHMPRYTVEILQDVLNDARLAVRGTAIGVMGLSYKANIDDLRESPAVKIIAELEKKKAKVLTFDPYIKSMSNVKTIVAFLKRSTALILVTNHQQFLDLDPKEFKKAGVKVIVDGMNCLDGAKIKRLGIKYHGIGRK